MMRDKFDFSSLDPDIVTIILQKVVAMAPEFNKAVLTQIEQQVRADYGGQRFFVPKGTKRLTDEQRSEVFKDGLTNMPDQKIIEKHKISRATLYRVMKSGGRGRFS